MPEINLKLKTKKIPSDDSYFVDDMKEMFGGRIKNAVCEEHTKDNRVFQALIAKEISKICKWWKFWNRDIRRAWKKYEGSVIVPYILINKSPIIMDHHPNIEINIKDKYKVIEDYEKNN